MYKSAVSFPREGIASVPLGLGKHIQHMAVGTLYLFLHRLSAHSSVFSPISLSPPHFQKDPVILFPEPF
jgi:hypothetical protein